MVRPLPSALVSAITVLVMWLWEPPYSAMPLASVDWTIVLLLNVMLESAAGYDQRARPSSPSLRRKLFLTVSPVALPLKLRPSASVDRTMEFSTVMLVLPYCSQNPTLVSWIHSPF